MHIVSFVAYIKCLIFIYDITNKKSFNSFNNWLNKIKKLNWRMSNRKLIIVIGNKLDLCNNKLNKSKREVKTEYVKKFCKNYNNSQNSETNDTNKQFILKFGGEISCRENIGITKLIGFCLEKYCQSFVCNYCLYS